MDPELQPSALQRASRRAIVTFVAGLGPARQAFGRAVGDAWMASRPLAERRRTARNHQRLQRGLSWPDAQRLARRSYRGYVTMIVDSIWAETLNPEQIRQRVQISGRAHLDADGRGGVIAVTHFGNWDMAASAALAVGVPMTTVMGEIISPAFTKMVAESRREKGLELYTPRQAARGLVRALRHRRQIALMADVPEAGPTVTVPYCGGRVRFSAVPARLARAFHVPLVPAACWRDGSGWMLELHAPLTVDESQTDADVMAAVAAVLEPHVRAHPEQWYPFHEVYVPADDG